MTGVRVKLGPTEEVALRRVALRSSHGLRPASIQRLQRLHLIEADKASWRLTALGQQRLKALPQPVKLVTGGAWDEIARILEKFTKQKQQGH